MNPKHQSRGAAAVRRQWSLVSILREFNRRINLQTRRVHLELVHHVDPVRLEGIRTPLRLKQTVVALHQLLFLDIDAGRHRNEGRVPLPALRHMLPPRDLAAADLLGVECGIVVADARGRRRAAIGKIHRAAGDDGVGAGLDAHAGGGDELDVDEVILLFRGLDVFPELAFAVVEADFEADAEAVDVDGVVFDEGGVAGFEEGLEGRGDVAVAAELGVGGVGELCAGEEVDGGDVLLGDDVAVVVLGAALVDGGEVVVYDVVAGDVLDLPRAAGVVGGAGDNDGAEDEEEVGPAG
eukprot:CAMPEP_0174889304 /NCGR_PEP_ID=MMETSP0167-20121228/4575_1 /TAXON_ID=38298 /ORGANISM="Rhodella maculata, Strain CCMP736" /LENGTH=294 /DNA_ID=CAMNT_0016126663 /DNA_START=159 /DNA_END=1040 /DNA_ORIENTATION=+